MAAVNGSVTICPRRVVARNPGYRRGMPRLPRYVLPSEGVYHVTARGVARCAISRDDDDRRFFLAMLGQVVRRAD